MKRLSILALALVFAAAMTLSSCWTTGSVTEPTRFEGRWFDPIAVNNNGFADYSYTFTGDAFVLSIVQNEGFVMNRTYNGTFKFTDRRIRFTTGEIKWTQDYTITNNELSLTLSRKRLDGTAPVAGSFIKQ